MPVFNGEPYLVEAVESVLGQTFADFELIAIDDGSTDGSLALLERYAARDARMRLVSRENRGIRATRNELLSLARGELVAVLDCDDAALPERLALQVAFLQEHPHVVCVGGAFRNIDHWGRYLTTLQPPRTDVEIQAQLLEGSCAICHSTVMMRLASVKLVGGYRLELAEDLDLWLRLGEIGALGNLPQALTSYRLHSGSVSENSCQAERDAGRTACEDAWRRRGIEHGVYRADHPWRPGPDRASRHAFALRYGWWAWNSRERGTARSYGCRAIKLRPFALEGWKLLGVSLVKPLAPQLAELTRGVATGSERRQPNT